MMERTKMMKRNWMHRLGAFAAAAALVLSLAGCGAEQSGGPADVEPVLSARNRTSPWKTAVRAMSMTLRHR